MYRIKIDLFCVNQKTQKYNSLNTEIRSFIYSLLNDTIYRELHNQVNMKLFTFSRIMSYSKSIQRMDIKYLIISSSDKGILDIIYKKLWELVYDNNSMFLLRKVIANGGVDFYRGELKLGDLRFVITKIKKQSFSLRRGDTVKSINPIVLSYVGDSKKLYWGSDKCKKDFNLFKDLLEKNLIKKYLYSKGLLSKESYEANKSLFVFDRDFEESEYISSVSIPVMCSSGNDYIIGSQWKFKISSKVSKETLDLLNVCFFSGFGSKTTYGMGFMFNNITD